MKKELERINAQIKKLEEKRQRIMTGWRADEVKKIVQLMRDNAITPEDIVPLFATGRRKKKQAAARPTSRKTRGPVAPKYRHPQTGETWTGRGRAPRWLVAEENAGVDRATFRIERS